MRSEIAGRYRAKYSLGVVDSENSLALYDNFFRNMGFHETIEQMIQKRLGEKPSVHVLDIGCGDAGFLSDLKKAFGDSIQTIGIDLLAPEHEGSRRGGPDVFLQGDAVEADFPGDLDFVFSFRALHEIGEPEKIVEKAYNSLARGGRAFLSFRTMDMAAGGKGLAELQEKEIRALLKMVRSRKLGAFKVEGFEVTVNGETGKKLTAGVNVFLEK